MSEAEIVTKAAEALSLGDGGRAAALLNVAAERGDAEAQYRLGEMLYNGDVPTQAFPDGEASYRMQRTATRWLFAAAQADHSGAQARLGLIYLASSDAGVREEGRHLLARAAAAGDPLAQQHVQANSQPRPDGAAAIRILASAGTRPARRNEFERRQFRAPRLPLTPSTRNRSQTGCDLLGDC